MPWYPEYSSNSPKYIPYEIEKHILIFCNVLYKSSSNSPFVQVLHEQIKGGGKLRLQRQSDPGLMDIRLKLIEFRSAKKFVHSDKKQTKGQGH